MAENTGLLVALSLAAALAAAAILGRRAGNAQRCLRLMLGTGAGFGGLALLVSTFQE